MKVLTPFLLLLLFVNCSQGDALEKINRPNEVVEQPDPNRQSKTWRFAVISDMNGSYGSKTYSTDVKRAVNHLVNQKDKLDFLISTGDMVAGQRKNLDYEGMWQAFQSTVTQPLKAAGLPLYPSPGNHDAYITRITERNHYKKSWLAQDVLSVPSEFQFVPGVKQDFPFSYAFTIGSGLFIALDNTDPRPFKKEKLEWLDDVLTRTKNIKFKVIYGHIPLLPFAFRKETEYNARGSVTFLEKMEELLEKYKVSLYLSGHSHVYYPGRRFGSTQMISVPLLGGGPRYLITQAQEDLQAQHGFLVISYSADGTFELKSIRSDNFNEISDDQLPEQLTMPTTDSGRCRKGCKDFPKAMFLDENDRSLYIRRDL